MEIAIEQAKKEDLPAIIKIANTQLGKDYLTTTLSESIDNKGYLLEIAKLANSRIIGFGLYQLNKAELIIKSIAVNPEFTKKGMATKFVLSALDYANSNSYSIVKSYAWQGKNGIQMKGIFTKLGFTKKEELPNYWKQDSFEKEYNCPTCGEPPCLCSAVVFAKQL